MQYANLSTASWAQGDTTITYTYDANGSVETKTTVTGAAVKEDVTYHYNLAGRLDKVTTDDQSGTEHVVEYIYNDEGIRVWAYSYDQPTGGGTKTLEKTIVYLVDSYNHTGYAQVLEEMTFNKADPDPLTETPDSLTTYVIGDDVIAQTKDGTTQYLLYDGHGSTRQLAEYDSAVSIADTYSYDGYGVLLQDNAVASSNPGKVGTQATNLLYAGEQFDTALQMYYNRARYYDQNTGRFNRTDPFGSNNHDPQSLHKYLYAHNNPINGIDPSGQFFTMAGAISAVSIQSIMGGVMLGSVANAGFRAKSTLASGEGIFQYVLDNFFSKLLDWAFFGTRQTYNWVLPSPIPGSQFTISAGVEGDFYHPFTSGGSSSGGIMLRVYASGGIHVFGSVPPGATPRLKNWTRPASLPILAKKWFMPGMALRVPFRHGFQGTELGDHITGEIGVVASAGWSSLSLGYKHMWSFTDGTRRWEAGFGVGQGTGIAIEIGLVIKVPYWP